jgi:NAD(P)-dependent dehydrogenase (short-subunit alcohol dehydrogenase family)
MSRVAIITGASRGIGAVAAELGVASVAADNIYAPSQ